MALTFECFGWSEKSLLNLRDVSKVVKAFHSRLNGRPGISHNIPVTVDEFKIQILI